VPGPPDTLRAHQTCNLDESPPMKPRITRFRGERIDLQLLWHETCGSVHPSVAPYLIKAFDVATQDGTTPESALAWLQDALECVAFYLEGDSIQRERDARDAAEAESRRAYLAKQKKPIPASLRTAVFERDRYRCVRCGGHRKLCADHVIPESRGGPATLDNLQTLCRGCNGRKSNRLESEQDDDGRSTPGARFSN
jgi:5-methylcytosine-specific restriction endonuclease McrA